MKQCEKQNKKNEWQGLLNKLNQKFWEKKHVTATFIHVLLVYTGGGKNY